jgi:hypothetical protein
LCGDGRRRHPTGKSDELEKNEDDEADEGKGFGEGDAEEHGGSNHAGGLGLTSHGLNRLTYEVADADAWAECGKAVGDASLTGSGDGL